MNHNVASCPSARSNDWVMSQVIQIFTGTLIHFWSILLIPLKKLAILCRKKNVLHKWLFHIEKWAIFGVYFCIYSTPFRHFSLERVLRSLKKLHLSSFEWEIGKVNGHNEWMNEKLYWRVTSSSRLIKGGGGTHR